MRNLWVILCSALTLTLFAGCAGNEPATTTEASLELAQSVVDVTADGGTFEVAYTLTGASAGAELKVNVQEIG